MLPFFYKFFKNLTDCFRGRLLFWHILAIVSTYVIVISGFDWFYFQSLQNTFIYYIFFPAVIIGGLFPIIMPLIMLAIGKIEKSKKIMNTGWGIGQAALIGLLISWFYKIFTGRIQPPMFLANTVSDISHSFRFGIFRGGVFWGWPSSHTTVAFTIAITLWLLYSNRPVIKYLALAYAVYVGLGVSMNIHWLSDAVAGAILGTIVGLIVGKSFKEREMKL